MLGSIVSYLAFLFKFFENFLSFTQKNMKILKAGQIFFNTQNCTRCEENTFRGGSRGYSLASYQANECTTQGHFIDLCHCLQWLQGLNKTWKCLIENIFSRRNEDQCYPFLHISRTNCVFPGVVNLGSVLLWMFWQEIPLFGLLW